MSRQEMRNELIRERLSAQLLVSRLPRHTPRCRPGAGHTNPSEVSSRSLPVPRLEYVTVSEFESTPKCDCCCHSIWTEALVLRYVRGRITVTDVNNTIDALQAALEEKCKVLETLSVAMYSLISQLLAVPKSRLTAKQREQVARWTEEKFATSDLGHEMTLSPEDIKEICKLQVRGQCPKHSE